MLRLVYNCICQQHDEVGSEGHWRGIHHTNQREHVSGGSECDALVLLLVPQLLLLLPDLPPLLDRGEYLVFVLQRGGIPRLELAKIALPPSIDQVRSTQCLVEHYLADALLRDLM